MKQIIFNPTLINEGSERIATVVIDQDRIADILYDLATPDDLPQELRDTAELIDARGLWLLPGCIDDQVHFREPGLTHKGDIAHESRAAVAGGVTSYMDMPNVKPPTIHLEQLLEKRQIAAESSWANYAFYIGGTNSDADEVCAIDPSLVPGLKLFLGASTGNMLVDSEEELEQFFAKAPKIIATHCESEEIIQHNKALYSERYDGHPPVSTHPLIRSREACYASTRSTIERAKRHGTRLHVLHLSTADEMPLFDASPLSPEKRITAEVCVHHLWFTDADYDRLGARIKWNPAVKTAADRNALRRALVEGRIDVVATDHAPHLLSEKEGDALTAASGGPLVQFSLLMMLELAKEGLWSPALVVEKMAHAPARLFGVELRGYVRRGYYADLVLVDPTTTTTVASDMLLSKCGWSPLEGHTFPHRVARTWVNGCIVYADGRLADHRPTVHPLTFTPVSK